MGLVKDAGGNKLTITYGGQGNPIGGIDATKETPIYLAPDAVADLNGFQAVSGYLSTIAANPIGLGPVLAGVNETVEAFAMGDVQVFGYSNATLPNQVIRNSFSFIISSSATVLQVTEYPNGFLGVGSNTYSVAAPQATNISYKVVNGKVYITGLGLGAIYVYTPALTGGSTLTLLSSYVGGQFIGELNGRLVLLACDQIVAGVYTYFPFRISWSAGLGQYGIWNPTSSNLVTGAGYSDLPDVADEITGFGTTGPTGYIIRKQGITEMTPLSSGIEPFDFNHLWASDKGIGSIYPNTVCQYGSLIAFLSDSGIYTLGYSGVNTIHGRMWGQICEALETYFDTAANLLYQNAIYNITAGLSPIYLAEERFIYYILFIPGTVGSLFIGDVLTQEWSQVPFLPTSSLYASFDGYVDIKAMSRNAVLNTGSDQSLPVILASTIASSGVNAQLEAFQIQDSFLPLGTLPNVPSYSISVDFQIEEVSPYKEITVNALLVYLDMDISNGVSVSVQPSFITQNANGSYTTLAYGSGSVTGTGQWFTSTPLTIPFTGRYPQLRLTMALPTNQTSTVRVYKVVMFCSYDKAQVP